MLRARLALDVGAGGPVSVEVLRAAAAAVELVHTASLLHDDVIDGGLMRRAAPAFWVDRGIPGAILFGDLLMFKALELLGRTGDGSLAGRLIELAGIMCEAESEQELGHRGHMTDWNACVDIARRKTGSLFAFAARAAGGSEERLCAALQSSGFDVGTAYQIADDYLDASGRDAAAGKTLGSDAARRKTTAASSPADSPADPAVYVEELCEMSTERLAEWPEVRERWAGYLENVLEPVLQGALSFAPGR